MTKTRVTIVGLGAIGCSLGLALQRSGAEVEITGHDKEPLASRQAQKIGAVHKTHWNLISACDGADLVVLAIPLQGIRDTLKALGGELRPGCVVTDTATVKTPVAAWAAESLPQGVYYVGGNPIVATEGAGADAAKADLFQEATWCVVSSAPASSDAIQLVTNVVTACGAKPYFVDVYEHDGLLAATDHLPTVLAAALLKAVGASPALREMRKVGSQQLAVATLPAWAEAATSRDVCLLNQENILRWLEVMQATLREVHELLAGGDEAQVGAFFEEARASWRQWQRGESAETSEVSLSDVMPSMRSMLFGRLRGLDRPAGKKRSDDAP